VTLLALSLLLPLLLLLLRWGWQYCSVQVALLVLTEGLPNRCRYMLLHDLVHDLLLLLTAPWGCCRELDTKLVHSPLLLLLLLLLPSCQCLLRAVCWAAQHLLLLLQMVRK
jgi:hypothetical protein